MTIRLPIAALLAAISFEIGRDCAEARRLSMN
jgi:hypothetical protein